MITVNAIEAQLRNVDVRIEPHDGLLRVTLNSRALRKDFEADYLETDTVKMVVNDWLAHTGAT